MNNSLLSQRTWVTQQLVESYPPKWKHPYKLLVYRLSCPEGAQHRGELTFTRWKALPLPEALPDFQPTVEARPDFFTYEPSDQTQWHLNFAHHDLFCAYGGPLFAQDEMQVAEHPALASLREALLKEGIAPYTVERASPTPILIQNVERRCAINTTGLYGNAFARTDATTIQKAVQPLSPPTLSNILAMEAPSGGYGPYTRRELEYILTTAYTGFAAAQSLGGGRPTTIHTGFWGCGAYGGNRTLMTALQLLAARLAGIAQIVFHTGDEASLSTITTAQALLARTEVSALWVHLAALEGQNFHWGRSDGN